MMEHLNKAGMSKIVTECSYPLTAKACVSRIYTDLAVLEVMHTGMRVLQMAPGVTAQHLQSVTPTALVFGS